MLKEGLGGTEPFAQAVLAAGEGSRGDRPAPRWTQAGGDVGARTHPEMSSKSSPFKARL